uniref:Uncharacterized protein n=1 Tax=Arundo donax TaxID=35708 RepID=A0A0A9D1N7_ARUDO
MKTAKTGNIFHILMRREYYAANDMIQYLQDWFIMVLLVVQTSWNIKHVQQCRQGEKSD